MSTLLPVALAGLLAGAALGAAHAGPPAHSTWQLTFQDEFDGDRPNWDVWESQAGPSGHILSSRWPENVEVKDGLLRLLTRKEKRGGQEWTSGNVWVKGRRFGCGYYEARYRYGAATGLNNAFWLWKDLKGRPPGLTEIDINEGHFPNEIATNLHLHNDGKGRHYGAGDSYRVEGADLSKEFHVYGLEWNERELVYYFDGRPIRRLPHNVAYDGEMKLLFSSAVINWAGKVTDALDGTSMDVDWVRVYTRQGPAASAPEPTAPAPSVPAPGATRALLREGFEGAAEGALPEGWRALSGKPGVVMGTADMECFRMARHGNLAYVDPVRVDDPGSVGGKQCLRLLGKDDLALLPFPAQKGRMEVTFRVLLASPGSVLRVGLVAPGLEEASGWSWIPRCGPYLGWQDLGYLGYYAGDRWHTFAVDAAGAWTTVRLVVDVARQTFDCYLGDVPAPAATGRFRSAQEALGGLVFAKGDGRYGPEPAWVDNVVVSDQ